MDCPSCGHANREGAKFCLGCGQRFSSACGSCGAELPAGSRFCDECGAQVETSRPSSPIPPTAEPSERSPRDYTPAHLAQKILQSKSALEGERKRVTVLFADVTHSMDLAEELDPEAWHGVLDGLFQVLADGVHRFEGTVNQYTGDGIMALFGAPVAHEDHAQRACYAALHLHDELDRYATEVKREHGVGISVRMGLNSGDVVVGKIGDDLRMDYTAQGHTVGLAQRMESLASPGECYLGDGTAELASGYFDLEDLGEFKVKGASTPARVHRLVGLGPAQTRFDVSRARGLTRFVGRDADMRLLDDALAQARAGNGQVVGVVAPAGTGKSRLCFEFVERCRAEGLEVLEGRAVAHGRNIPFLPILEIFRAYFGIEEGDTDRTVREKVAGRLLLIDEALRDDLPVLFDFFGVPDPDEPPLKLDADTRQKKLFGLMHRLARDDQSSEPRVYLVEDLHWIDGGSEVFLQQMVDGAAGTRNLVIANFRPEYHADWMSRSWYHQLPLAPLGPEAIRELLDDLLGSDPSIAGLGDAIHERTGGNPFFTEEVVQSLIESGHLEGTRGQYELVTPIERLGVPASVHAVLAARIDRLAEREKHVLQSAGVIGKDFARPILEPVVALAMRDLDAAIAALKDGEFVYEQSLYPVAEYAFKHPLTQEVALASLLRERRRDLHRAVAGAIEQANPESLDENAALLAHHWDEAGEALPAARWHLRAAVWAGITDIEESLRHYERTRKLLADVPGDESDLLRMEACRGILRVGWRVGEDLTPVYQEGRALAERRGDADAALRVTIPHARTVTGRGELRHCLELSEECLRLAATTDDLGLRISAENVHIDCCSFLGELRRALEHGESALRTYPPDPDLGADVFDMSGFGILLLVYGNTLVQAGRFEEAFEVDGRSAEIAMERKEYELALYAHLWTMNAHWFRGDARSCASEARRVAELLEPAGSSATLRAWTAKAATCSRLLEKAWDQAVETADDWLAIYESEKLEVVGRPEALALRCEALHRAGRHEEAVTAGDLAIAGSRDMGRDVCELHAQLFRAISLAHVKGSGAREEVYASLDRAAELLETTGARAFAPQLIEARARVARVFGDTDTWERELREAHRLYEELDCPGRAEEIAKELE